MAIQLFCTNCGNPLIVPNKLSGARLECGACEEVNTVPDVSDVEEVPDDQVERSGRYTVVDDPGPSVGKGKQKKKKKKKKNDEPTVCTTCGAMVPAGDPICCACGTEVVAGGANVPLGMISLILVLILVGGGGFGIYRFTRPGSLTSAGRDALEIGRTKQAIQSFQEALSYDPDYGPAILGLVEAALEENNAALLQRYLDRAIKLCASDEERGELRVTYAEQLLKQSKWRDAYNQAFDAQGDDPNVRGADAVLGLASVELDQVKEAISHLKKAWKADRQDARVAYALAKLLAAEEGREGQAVEPAQAAAELVPDDSERWLLVADLRDRLNQRGRARQALKKVIELDEKHSLAHGLLAKLYLADGNTDGALKAATSARDLNPEDPQASLSVAGVLYAQGKYPDVLDELGRMFRLKQKLIEAREADARFLQRKAQLHTGKGKTEPMRPVLDALDVLGKLERYLELAEIAIKNEAWKVAEDTLGAAVAKYPRDYDTRVLLARAYLEQIGGSNTDRLVEKIRAQLDAALKIDKDEPEAHRLLGSFFLGQGDKQSAEQAFAAGLKEVPSDSELLAQHGQVCMDLKKWNEAIASLKRLKKVDPTYDRVDKMLKRAEEGLFYDE